MIKLKKIIKEIMGAIPPPAIINQHQQFSPDFIKYIQSIENSIHAGFNKDKNLWFPYMDNGLWHIGYGHKIENGELQGFKNGTTQESVIKLLVGDLDIAKKRVDDYIKRSYKYSIPLSKEQTEMLVDFSYNLGGLNKFPKLTDAVIRQDWNKVKQEYVRKANGKEITSRNKAFYDKFLANKK